jgi:hypothetical protein
MQQSPYGRGLQNFYTSRPPKMFQMLHANLHPNKQFWHKVQVMIL